MGIVALLTDFGTRDYYVAAVKGVILQRAPDATLVDISHDVPAGDVATAAFLLGAATPAFPQGTVFLAVVDPGVGSERRILAADTDHGRYLAPDNGVLTPILDSARLHTVERPDLYLPAPGQTFHGRDRFAPVAAALLQGEPRERLGPPVSDPVRLPSHEPSRDGDRLQGHVVHIDRFGNLVTDIPLSWLDRPLALAQVGRHRATSLVSHYQELEPGEAGVVPGSVGTLELSLNGASLAAAWGVERGAAVTVHLQPVREGVS